MKKALLTSALLSLCLLLTSCDASPLDYIYSVLGVDNTDYYGEEVINILDTDDETVKKLAESAVILASGEEIVTFESFKHVKEEYFDTVLDYLAGKYYARYSADTEMMELFSENYPELTVSTLIPQEDYENTVYTFFGGGRKALITSSARYTYLDKIDAFMLVGTLDSPDVTCRAVYAEETEHTYRIIASFFENGDTSEEYEIVFMKRESGEPYIYRVTESNRIIAG